MKLQESSKESVYLTIWLWLKIWEWHGNVVVVWLSVSRISCALFFVRRSRETLEGVWHF